jgi:hypothetical protein
LFFGPDTAPDDNNKGKPAMALSMMNLSFSGAGFLGIYQVWVRDVRRNRSAWRSLTVQRQQLGAAAALRQVLGPKMRDERVAAFVGTSVRVYTCG